MLTDKEIFESLMALAQIGGGIGAQDVDRIVRAVASAYVNPNGRTAQALAQAAIRYENVTNPVLPAYDERSAELLGDSADPAAVPTGGDPVSPNVEYIVAVECSVP